MPVTETKSAASHTVKLPWCAPHSTHVVTAQSKGHETYTVTEADHVRQRAGSREQGAGSTEADHVRAEGREQGAGSTHLIEDKRPADELEGDGEGVGEDVDQADERRGVHGPREADCKDGPLQTEHREQRSAKVAAKVGQGWRRAERRGQMQGSTHLPVSYTHLTLPTTD